MGAGKSGRISSIKISISKGQPRKAVQSAKCIEAFGIEGDRFSGKGLRQVSLLAAESLPFRNDTGWCTQRFAENILTKGAEIWNMKAGDRLLVGEAHFEIVQVGNACHEGCPLRREGLSCLMPGEVVFAKVVKGAEISIGDKIQIAP